MTPVTHTTSATIKQPLTAPCSQRMKDEKPKPKSKVCADRFHLTPQAQLGSRALSTSRRRTLSATSTSYVCFSYFAQNDFSV